MTKELKDKIANSMIEKGGLIADDLEMIYQQGREDVIEFLLTRQDITIDDGKIFQEYFDGEFTYKELSTTDLIEQMY